MSLTSEKRTPYEMLGGDAGVRVLVDAFYDRMDLEEAFSGIRALEWARQSVALLY